MTEALVSVFCDFNGTVVDRDMIDYLATTVVNEEASATTASTRGTRAEIARKAGLLRFGPAEAERRIERGIRFDESFPEFWRSCERRGFQCIIVTSGIRDLVERYLRRRDVSARVVGNSAEYSLSGWGIRFHDESVAGIDKSVFSVFIEEARSVGHRTVVVGDDISDFTAAKRADRVFAKQGSPLDRHLADARIPGYRFLNFADLMTRWLVESWWPQG